MSILNITNLTDNPQGWIKDRFMGAFEELEREIDDTISNEDRLDFIDNQIDQLEETANETKGSDLLGLIDNYLVNLDYYSEVKEWWENKD